MPARRFMVTKGRIHGSTPLIIFLPIHWDIHSYYLSFISTAIHSFWRKSVLPSYLLINSVHAVFLCSNDTVSQSRVCVPWVPEFSEIIPHSASRTCCSHHWNSVTTCLYKNIHYWHRGLLVISLCIFWILLYLYNLSLCTFILILHVHPQYFRNSVFSPVNLHIWMMR
jgi:hypothetical protein